MAIANATAFVGTFGGLSFVAPHYGVSSLCFRSVAPQATGHDRKGIWRDLDLAKCVFSRPGWGRFALGGCDDAPVEDLLAPVLAR